VTPSQPEKLRAMASELRKRIAEEPLTPSLEQNVDRMILSVLTRCQAERDMEWWEQLVLVDNVAPTPEAAKAWLLALSAHEQEGARAEQRAADLEKACMTILTERGLSASSRLIASKSVRRAFQPAAKEEKHGA